MKLGARILKTGIAIVLALYLATWLVANARLRELQLYLLSSHLFIDLLTIVDQVQANIIGAALAITFGLLSAQDQSLSV